MIGVDISALYKNIGVNTAALVRYRVPNSEIKQPSIVFNVPEITIEKGTVTNYLGLPVIFPVTFKGGTYEIYNNSEVEQIKLNEFRLPDTTICSFKAQKQSVESIISGGNTRIIEVWSDLLWDIEIKGIILPNPEQTTQEILENLILYSRIKEVRIEGDLFTWLGIYQIFLKDIDIQQQQGWGDIVTFSMSCIETEPIELIL